MQKTIGMLGVLLAIQLLLAVSLSFTGPDLSAQRPDTPLLALDGQTVDRLTIEGPGAQQVLLARQGNAWVLPGSGDFPADAAKVGHLLERLQGMQRGLPVATTEGAQKRFKVSAADYERRLTLSQGEKTLATLFLGTSPAMRQVHARTAEDTAVYTTEFGIHEVPLKPEDWEDKGMLKIPQQEIQAIDLNDLALARLPAAPTAGTAAVGGEQGEHKPAWNSTGLAQGETINQANADALAQQLAGLTYAAVLGREAKAEYGMEAPALLFSVKRQGGATLEYRLGKRDAENDYVLKVSSRPEYFRLPGYSAEALLKASGRDRLVNTALAAAGTDQPRQESAAGAPSQGPAAPVEAAPAEGRN